MVNETEQIGNPLDYLEKYLKRWEAIDYYDYSNPPLIHVDRIRAIFHFPPSHFVDIQINDIIEDFMVEKFDTYYEVTATIRRDRLHRVL